MVNVRRIFFPLRSNVGWFQTGDLRRNIHNKFKQALLLYDELIIEDGTYEANVLENGAWSPYYPPGTVDVKERVIKFEKDIDPVDAELSISKTGSSERRTLLRGRTVARFKMDYYEMLREINVIQSNFIKLGVFNDSSFPVEVNELIRRMKQTNPLSSQEEPNAFLRSLIHDDLNRDLVVSVMLGSAIFLDQKHREYLEKKSKLLDPKIEANPVKEEVVFRHVVNLLVPNFQLLSIPEVIE